MNNTVLRKDDLVGLLEQLETLEANADGKVQVNSITVKFTSGVTGTFTKASSPDGWQVTVNGAPDPVLGGYRDR